MVESGVLGNTHKPEQACGELAPLDPEMSADGLHTVDTVGAVSTVRVPNDPQRVVVIGDGPLDTLCALGLQSRVVALAPSASPEMAPRYLGSWVAELPMVGADGVVDVDAIGALGPDVIVTGPDGFADGQRRALEAIAPTVAAAGGTWQSSVETVGDGVGRGAAVRAALDAYRADTAAAGEDIAAAQTEVSMVRFTADGTEILGESSFAGRIFADLGLRRPVAQRFREPMALAVDEVNLRPAEGDFLYISFEGKNSGLSDRGGDNAAVKHGVSVMDSDPWRALGVTGGRSMVVDDGIWVDGGGLIAARLISQDIQASL